MSPERDATAKGWPARKFYLSPEAIELLEGHCKGTPLTMSAYLDMLIKNALGSIPVTKTQEPPAVSAERAKKAALDRGIAEARQTFAVPDGHEVVRNREGRAIGTRQNQPAKKDQPFDL